MIKIRKKNKIAAPTTLTNAAKLIKEMSDDYDKGIRTFEFDNKIYGAEDVKSKLIKLQNYKCCFCEARIGHIDDGDVEHFRPKKGYKQSPKGTFIKPGYYWLAYEWNNLFLSCTKCNRRNKINLFPLESKSFRSSSHKDDIKREKPIFLHPADDNPEDHITFVDNIPFAKNNSLRGKMTIKYLKLNRSLLNEDRKERLDDLKTLFEIVIKIPTTPPGLKREAIANLIQQKKEKTLDTYPYANMFRAFFSKNPIPPMP